MATFSAGTLELQHGGALTDARIVYQTFGEPAADGSNVVVMPTYYTGRHEDNVRMIGPGRALDPERWFIVIPNMFGNGLSTSPSNAGAAQRGADFPSVSILDNVRAQRQLLHMAFGIERVRLVLGWSMGDLVAGRCRGPVVYLWRRTRVAAQPGVSGRRESGARSRRYICAGPVP